MAHKLAIVVPAFKAGFLELALRSLATQTDSRFSLYVFDDASSEALEPIFTRVFGDAPHRHYHRFTENWGGRSLTRHWNRCIDLTSEPWIWLFSDDDLADPCCVEAFHNSLSDSPSSDVYRFRKQVIDDEGALLPIADLSPQHETSQEMVLARFRGGMTTVPEHIFSRAAYEREGGFVDFPLAWFSDDATWAAFGRKTGIWTLPGGQVFWRYGASNLSSANRKHTFTKLVAIKQYLSWLKTFDPSPEFQTAVRSGFKLWFPQAFMALGGALSPIKAILVFGFYSLYTRTLNPRLLLRLVGTGSSFALWLNSLRQKRSA